MPAESRMHLPIGLSLKTCIVLCCLPTASGALLRAATLRPTPAATLRPTASSIRMLDASLLPSTSTHLLATTAIDYLQAGPASDPVGFAFEFVTLVPQPFWLLMVLLPNWKGTRLLFEPIQPLAVLSLFHLLIVTSAISMNGTPDSAPLDLFNNLFDTSKDGVATYMELGTYR